MRFVRPVQRFVAPQRVPPKVPVAELVRGSCAQYTVSWPHREFYRRYERRNSHAVPAPSAALRGLIGSCTEGSSGGTRMRFLRTVQRFVAP
eukprot:1629118-Pyramimonas_sp.AAC.1